MHLIIMNNNVYDLGGGSLGVGILIVSVILGFWWNEEGRGRNAPAPTPSPTQGQDPGAMVPYIKRSWCR